MKNILAVIFTLLLVAACGGGGGGNSVPVPDPTPVPTPVPDPTPVPTPVPDPTPVPTPVPVPVPDPVPVYKPIATPNELRYETLLTLNTMRFWGYCGSGGKFWGQNQSLAWNSTLEEQASIHIQQVAVTIPHPLPADNEILRQGSWTIGDLLSTRMTEIDCAKLMNPAYTTIGVSSFGEVDNPFWSVMLGTAVVSSFAPTLIIGPVTAYGITQTEAKVSWSVTEPATGQTEYGTTTENGVLSTLENSYIYTTHIQSLSGLSPGTLYWYRAHSTDASGEDEVSAWHTFRTLSPS